ncbi:hypothetical protein DFH94DRAFT_785326 [Russula ochroleuca]|uniref:Uncharacterized protein n=1 Tax=Russula ochroleuca TaxID=152965 RepID=A0A9P5JVX0_9AGAM|nr:hypothetical protein DFH94DRAFT_785326 [Russula ochroleuca]
MLVLAVRGFFPLAQSSLLKTRADSLTMSPRHVGTRGHLRPPDQSVEDGSLSTLRAHKYRMLHMITRGFAAVWSQGKFINNKYAQIV